MHKKTSDIYVEFELNRDAVINILSDKENLDNVAEINSYSIFDTNGNVYAGIDKDSNPGNAVPGEVTSYQDDTDSAPALKLEVADAREMSGKVFLDATSGELMTGKSKTKEMDNMMMEKRNTRSCCNINRKHRKRKSIYSNNR